MRRRLLLLALLALGRPAALGAASLVVTKSSVVVSDGVSALNPRALPGALIDYQIVVTNPLANVAAVVGGVTVTDILPAGVKLRVATSSPAAARWSSSTAICSALACSAAASASRSSRWPARATGSTS